MQAPSPFDLPQDVLYFRLQTNIRWQPLWCVVRVEVLDEEGGAQMLLKIPRRRLSVVSSRSHSWMRFTHELRLGMERT
jgi:hypothetical protein